MRRALLGWKDGRRGCGQPLEGERGKKRDSLLEPPERNHPCSWLREIHAGLLMDRTARRHTCSKPLSLWFIVTASVGN